MVTLQESHVMKVAHRIFEDTCIFENPFPTPHQNWTAIYNGCTAALRQCNVKEGIRDINTNVDQMASRTFTHIQILCVKIMQLRKTCNNLKSCIVARVKANNRNLCEFTKVESPSEINKWIDFLLEHNRYY